MNLDYKTLRNRFLPFDDFLTNYEFDSNTRTYVQKEDIYHPNVSNIDITFGRAKVSQGKLLEASFSCNIKVQGKGSIYATDIISTFQLLQDDNYEYPSIKCSYGFNLFNHLALFASLGVDFEIDGWNEGAFKDRKVPSSLDFDEWALYPTWEFGVKLRIR